MQSHYSSDTPQPQQLTFILGTATTRLCGFCQAEFTPRYDWQLYCSNDGKCRRKASYYRNHNLARERENTRRAWQRSTGKPSKPQAEMSKPLAELSKQDVQASAGVDTALLLEQVQRKDQQIDRLTGLVESLSEQVAQLTRQLSQAPIPAPSQPRQLSTPSAAPDLLPDFEVAHVAPEKGKAFANYMNSLSGMTAKPVAQKPTRKPKAKRQEPPPTTEDTQLVATISEAKPRQIAPSDAVLEAPSFDDLDVDF